MNKIYKQIILKFNGEQFRKERLIKLINEFEETTTMDVNITEGLIDEIEDDKGLLKIYWTIEPTILFKYTMEDIWTKLLYEINVKHIIKTEKKCKCCNSKPEQEDEEIKEYFKYINNIKSI